MASSKKNLVIKSNSLIEASYRLTIQEMRVVLLAITSANRTDSPITQDEFYQVTAEDFSRLSGRELKHSYEILKQVSDKLFDRVLTLTRDPEGNPLDPPIRTRWVQSDRAYKNASIAVKFSSEVVPYLTQLSRVFTVYDINQIGKLSSPYAVRLYELCIQYLSIGSRELSLQRLRECLEIGDKYKSFKEFKRNVLVPSLNAINESTDLVVSCAPLKKGRSIVSLFFYIELKYPKLDSKQIQKNARVGESWKDAERRLKNEALS